MPNGAYRWVDVGIYGKLGDVLLVDECGFVREFGIRENRYTNYRYAVVGEIVFRFLSNLARKARYLIPKSRKFVIFIACILTL